MREDAAGLRLKTIVTGKGWKWKRRFFLSLAVMMSLRSTWPFESIPIKTQDSQLVGIVFGVKFQLRVSGSMYCVLGHRNDDMSFVHRENISIRRVPPEFKGSERKGPNIYQMFPKITFTFFLLRLRSVDLICFLFPSFILFPHPKLTISHWRGNWERKGTGSHRRLNVCLLRSREECLRFFKQSPTR